MGYSVGQVASGSLADLGFQEEVKQGVLPAVPAMTVFRRRSTTLNLAADSTSSEEIRSDRQTSSSRVTARRAVGDVETELSPASYGTAWEALLGGMMRARTPITISGFTLTWAAVGGSTTRGTITRSAGSFVADGVIVGDRLAFSGQSNAYDGRRFTVVAMTTTVLTVVCDPNEVFTAVVSSTGLMTILGSWASVGNIARSYVFERAFKDIGRFIKYHGMRFNSAAIQLPPTGIATCTWNLMGTEASALALASYDGTVAVVRTQTQLGSLTFGAGNTVTCATSTWAAQGFAVGDVITFTALNATPQNVGKQFVIEALAATVATMAQATEAGSVTTYSVSKVGLPDYTAASTNDILTALTGQLLIDGEPVAILTNVAFTIDNGMAGPSVVGSKNMPYIAWGLRQKVSGTCSILFEDETLYNKFVNEQTISLLVRLDGTETNQFIQFYMPRVKLTTGSIGDAVAEGLPIEAGFEALLPTSVPVGGQNSQITIWDTF